MSVVDLPSAPLLILTQQDAEYHPLHGLLANIGWRTQTAPFFDLSVNISQAHSLYQQLIQQTGTLLVTSPAIAKALPRLAIEWQADASLATEDSLATILAPWHGLCAGEATAEAMRQLGLIRATAVQMANEPFPSISRTEDSVTALRHRELRVKADRAAGQFSPAQSMLAQLLAQPQFAKQAQDFVASFPPPYLYLRGERTRVDLLAQANAYGLSMQEQIIYQLQPIPRAALQMQDWLSGHCGATVILLASMQAAEYLAEQWNRRLSDGSFISWDDIPSLLCYSEKVAQPLRKILTASMPASILHKILFVLPAPSMQAVLQWCQDYVDEVKCSE